MREYKFRAWYTFNETTKEGTMLHVGDGYGTTHPLDVCNYKIHNQPIKLMQFTNFQDKHGIDIYEEDTLFAKIKDFNHTVSGTVKKDFTGEYVLITPKGELYPLTDFSEAEVTGNSFEVNKVSNQKVVYMTIDDKLKKEIFEYLDNLRESGKINMFEAPIHLANDFNLAKSTAREIWAEWALSPNKEK